MDRTIFGNDDVGRGGPGAVGGRRGGQERPRLTLPPGVLTGFSGHVRASLQLRASAVARPTIGRFQSIPSDPHVMEAGTARLLGRPRRRALRDCGDAEQCLRG